MNLLEITVDTNIYTNHGLTVHACIQEITKKVGPFQVQEPIMGIAFTKVSGEYSADMVMHFENIDYTVIIKEEEGPKQPTEEEFKRAAWKEGDLYWINTGNTWLLRYSSKNFGEFYREQLKSGETYRVTFTTVFKKADGVTLPEPIK